MDKYKTNNWLQAYPSNDQEGILLEDFYNKSYFVIDRIEFFNILTFCVQPRTTKEISSHLQETSNINSKQSLELIRQLLAYKLLTEEKSNAQKLEQETSFWNQYGWEEALDYFVAMKDYPFLDYESESAREVDNTMMDEYLANDPPPPIYKDYPGHPVVNLQKDFNALDDTDIRELLHDDVFDNSPLNDSKLTVKEISDIMLYTFGKMGVVEFPSQGEFLMKSSPSGGARHPIEAYLFSVNTDLGKGAYHYSVRNHTLEKLNMKFSEDKLNNIIYELKTGPQFNIKAIVVLTAVFPRSMWRYREPRSYRVVLHDLGHLLETMKIVCKAKRTKTYYGHGFHDEELENYLELNSSIESVLKFVALG